MKLTKTERTIAFQRYAKKHNHYVRTVSTMTSLKYAAIQEYKDATESSAPRTIKQDGVTYTYGGCIEGWTIYHTPGVTGKNDYYIFSLGHGKKFTLRKSLHIKNIVMRGY